MFLATGQLASIVTCALDCLKTGGLSFLSSTSMLTDVVADKGRKVPTLAKTLKVYLSFTSLSTGPSTMIIPPTTSTTNKLFGSPDTMEY